MTDSGKIVTAVAVGAVAGLITGILIAPDKGSETRKRIADSSKKVVDNVVDFANAGVSAVNNIKDKFMKQSNGTTANVPAEDTSW
jgi:gas vesicle protein